MTGKERYSGVHLAGLSFAAAVLTKLYPLILLPLFVTYLLTANDIGFATKWRNLIAFLVVCSGTVVLAYLPFLNIGIDRVTEGLRTYNAEWINNEGAFFFVSYLTNLVFRNTSFPADRLIANSIVGLLALGAAVWVFQAKKPFKTLINAVGIVLLVWFLLLPAVFSLVCGGIGRRISTKSKGISRSTERTNGDVLSPIYD